MLCQKCNTAMDAADTVCRNCGAAVPKLNRSWSKFAKISVVTLFVAAFAAYVVLHNLDMIDYGFIEDMFVSAPDTPDYAPSDDVGGGQYYYDAEGGDVFEIVTHRRSDEEQAEVLATILSAVDAYLRDVSHHNPMISHSGYLYNAGINAPVSMQFLAALGYLGEDFEDENVLVLYLRPMDLLEFDEVLMGELSQANRDRMTVFLAYQTPVGFGLFSDHGRHVIYRENLNALLMSYAPTSYAVVRPVTGDAAYQTALNVIAATNPGDAVFMRYLATDGVHGFAAFSLASNPHVVRNYIFVMDEDGARLLARDFEATLHPKVAINGAAPNFNFNLMPSYDIARIELLAPQSSTFADILNIMRQNEQLYLYDDPLFISATEDFAYIVTPLGNRFFGQNGPGGWVVEQVDNWQIVEQNLMESAHGAPLYIVWQQ